QCAEPGRDCQVRSRPDGNGRLVYHVAGCSCGFRNVPRGEPVMRMPASPLPILWLAAAFLVLTGDNCDRASTRCTAAPIGQLNAFLERPEAPAVSEFVGTVTSWASVPDGFQRAIIRLASGQDESLKVVVPRNLLSLDTGRRYSFRVEYVGGRPSASALVVS